MADWVRFHRELCLGNKRSIPRALRFIYMEVSLEAKRKRGYVVLPAGMDPVDALHDRLGGHRGEVEKAVHHFTSGQGPMWRFETEQDELRLYVHEWSKWNPIDPTGSERQARRRNGLRNGKDRDGHEDIDETRHDTERKETVAVTSPSAPARANLSLSSDLTLSLEQGSSKTEASSEDASSETRLRAVSYDDERAVGRTDQITEELRSIAEQALVQDIAGAWLKFCGYYDGRVIRVAGQWQKWCVNEAKRERTERDKRRREGPADPNDPYHSPEARKARQDAEQRRQDAEWRKRDEDAVPPGMAPVAALLAVLGPKKAQGGGT